MPTETVYGLAARIDVPQGIEAIFRIKERPFFDPLIIHVSSVQQAKTLTQSWPVAADVLAEAFWPGPLTLVLPKAKFVNPLITSGLETVGIRMPRHPSALKLINDEGVPLAAPSANKFGRTSPTTADHVRAEFGNLVPVIDGGPCEVGIESTVLRVHEGSGNPELTILRPGNIQTKDIEKAFQDRGMTVQWLEPSSAKESPGHLKHHYMPSVPVVYVKSRGLSKSDLEEKITQKLHELPDEVEGVKMVRPSGALRNMLVLKLSEDPSIAARELYSKLRELAGKSPDLILFYDEDRYREEVWTALLDRLTKAASVTV
jgi:L-threonylcarbamoyladenylate synthase